MQRISEGNNLLNAINCLECFYLPFNIYFMSKKNVNAIAKANKNVIETKESVNVEQNRLTSINLSQFADKLSNVELKEKREKETLYKYPDGWTKEKINSEEGKHFRNKLRNRLKSICNNIFFYAKGENVEMIKLEIQKFDAFYLENYRINDYSVNSITNSKDQKANIELTLAIIKSVKEQQA